jgi:hypothetical protein
MHLVLGGVVLPASAVKVLPTPGGPLSRKISDRPLPSMKSSNPSSAPRWHSTNPNTNSLWSVDNTRLSNTSLCHVMSSTQSTLNNANRVSWTPVSTHPGSILTPSLSLQREPSENARTEHKLFLSQLPSLTDSAIILSKSCQRRLRIVIFVVLVIHLRIYNDAFFGLL